MSPHRSRNCSVTHPALELLLISRKDIGSSLFLLLHISSAVALGPNAERLRDYCHKSEKNSKSSRGAFAY